MLVASRIGSERVVELLDGWIERNGLRVKSSALLKGIQTATRLMPVEGMHLETLPAIGNDFPRSLRIDSYDFHEEQFSRRAMLAMEYEVSSPLPPYVPETDPKEFVPPWHQASPVNQNLLSVSIETLCRASSLEMNNHVDWFIQWEDYGEVEAFFLNPGFSSRRKETTNPPPVVGSEKDVRSWHGSG